VFSMPVELVDVWISISFVFHPGKGKHTSYANKDRIGMFFLLEITSLHPDDL
jgi:hypothetical protein